MTGEDETEVVFFFRFSASVSKWEPIAGGDKSYQWEEETEETLSAIGLV